MEPWVDWARAMCLPDHCNCEGVRAGWIAQPSAFWTSLAYFISAGLLWSRVQSKNSVFRMWMVFLVLLAFASHFAHASMTEVAFAMDISGIALVMGCFTLYRLLSPRVGNGVIFGSLLFMDLGLTLGLVNTPKLLKLGLCVVFFSFILLETWIRDRKRFSESNLLKSLGWLALSFALFVFDESKLHCNPKSLIQAHSFWHLGSALSLYYYGIWRFEESS